MSLKAIFLHLLELAPTALPLSATIGKALPAIQQKEGARKVAIMAVLADGKNIRMKLCTTEKSVFFYGYHVYREFVKMIRLLTVDTC
jgi:hypothetical protein